MDNMSDVISMSIIKRYAYPLRAGVQSPGQFPVLPIDELASILQSLPSLDDVEAAYPSSLRLDKHD